MQGCDAPLRDCADRFHLGGGWLARLCPSSPAPHLRPNSGFPSTLLLILFSYALLFLSIGFILLFSSFSNLLLSFDTPFFSCCTCSVPASGPCGTTSTARLSSRSHGIGRSAGSRHQEPSVVRDRNRGRSQRYRSSCVLHTL